MYVYSHSKYGKLYQVVLYNLDYSLNEYESNVACIDVTIPFFFHVAIYFKVNIF